MSQGSMTVELAFVGPMAVMIILLVIVYCFCEHAHVWYKAAACEVALTGIAKREDDQDPERRALLRGQSRIEEQPFPAASPELQVQKQNKDFRVSYEAADEGGLSGYFSYKTEILIRQKDPVGAMRTAWLAKKIMNGG